MIKIKLKMEYGIWKWIKYSILFTILPLLLAILYNCWLGFNFSLTNPKYLSDFLLIIVSLAAGTLCGRDINDCHKCFSIPLIGDLPAWSIVMGLLFYTFIFGREDSLMEYVTKPIFILAIVLYVINAIMGFLSEKYNLNHKKGAKDETAN